MLTKNIEEMKTETLRHIEIDAVIQSIYWEASRTQGCFIGCLTHSSEAQKVTDMFGIELDIVLLLESIFEDLSEEDHVDFFRDIAFAIGDDGKDLSMVKFKFLRDTLKALPKQSKDNQNLIDPVIDGLDLVSNGGHWDLSEAFNVSQNASNAADKLYNLDEGGVDVDYVAMCAAYRSVDMYISNDDDNYGSIIRVSEYAVSAHTGRTEIKRQAESILELLKNAPKGEH
jgi:hypothetical protein